MRAKSFAVIFGLGVVSAFGTTGVDAQTNVQRIALKSGESVELHPIGELQVDYGGYSRD